MQVLLIQGVQVEGARELSSSLRVLCNAFSYHLRVLIQVIENDETGGVILDIVWVRSLVVKDGRCPIRCLINRQAMTCRLRNQRRLNHLEILV